MSARDDDRRPRFGGLFPRRPDVEIDDELAFHREQRVRDYVSQGMSPDEARRAAAERLGDVGEVRRECAALLAAERRTAARREGLRVSWLDVRLGARMLLKYPGLTLVGGLAMAFAICVGAVAYQIVGQFVNPTLSLAEGDRVVRIANWDAATGKPDDRLAHDLATWRASLRTVTDLGAYRDAPRTLTAPDGLAEVATIAEMSATGFRVARVAPLLGRTLVAGDEEPGAPDVVVLGHELWQRRFDGDARIVGRTVRIGDAPTTVVGVMPAGFAFPIAHEAWTPLRLDALAHAPRTGPELTAFARLAPGASRDAAQAELTAVGLRAAADEPATHEHLRPRVSPYTSVFGNPSNDDLAIMHSINGFAALLLVLVCGNVALLVFARAASREGELTVRSALGASRGRIVGQLFVEALVLGGAAAVVGVGAAYLALDRLAGPFLAANEVVVPFWFDLGLSPASVLYAAGLTVLGAAIAGVLPALKVTRGLAARLRAGTTGGGGPSFGGVWTAVIVAQVAVTVAFPVIAYAMQREHLRIQSQDPGFAAREYVAVRLDAPEPLTDEAEADEAARTARLARFGASVDEVRRRVAAQPGVAGVTLVDRLPRDYHRERLVQTDLDGVRADAPTHEVSIASVDPSYFDVLRAPVVAGRGFRAVDLAPDAHVAIVDRGFVARVLGGRNPIGARVRFVPRPQATAAAAAADVPPEPWLEIVGVVPDLGMAHAVQKRRAAGLYLPASPGGDAAVQLLVHARGEPLALAPRVRELAAATDPTLRVTAIQRMDTVADSLLWVLGLWVRVVAGLSGIALLLSLAGIYAVLSFTVARRTREIGVRVALGAPRRRVVTAVFRRPLIQVALGVMAGGALVAGAPLLLSQGDGDMVDPLTPRQLVLVVAYAAFMLGVCLLACVVPTQRALRVQPTEALRADA